VGAKISDWRTSALILRKQLKGRFSQVPAAACDGSMIGRIREAICRSSQAVISGSLSQETTMYFAKFAAATALVLAAGATPTLAANVDVQLLNKGDMGSMVFQPDLIKVNVGDTVTFQPSDKGHDVETIAGMIPAGAAAFKGDNSEPLTETFTVPGVYAIKCTPHYGLGMVAIVVVGNDLSNLDTLKAAHNPKRPQDRFNAIFSQLK
jgi:pseudoazurin